MQVGLVDELGGLTDAVEAAKKLAGLDEVGFFVGGIDGAGID